MTYGRVTSAGIKAEVTHKAHGHIPEYDGRHLWAAFAVFAISNPARERHELDMENLLTIEGPGCMHCERVWRPDIGSKCPGVPKETS